MAQFTGTMRIEGDRGAPLPVHAEIADNRLVLTTDGTDLGSWPLGTLNPQARGAGVGLLLDGDPVVIDVGNAERFFDAVALRAPSGKKKGRAKKPKVAPSAYEPEEKPDKAPRRRPSARVTATLVLLLAVVALAAFNPTLVGAVALFLGLVLVIVASGAVIDTRIALRLPVGLDAMHVMVGGVGVLLIGVFLTFLG